MGKDASISIIIGGTIGIVNFFILVRVAEKLLKGGIPNITIVFFSFIKVLITGLILFILLQFKLVAIPSFLLGFTCVVLLILFEGALTVKGAKDKKRGHEYD
jgi:hypothetical protein